MQINLGGLIFMERFYIYHASTMTGLIFTKQINLSGLIERRDKNIRWLFDFVYVNQ